MAEVNIVIRAVVPPRDTEAEEVEVGRENNWTHRRTSSGFLLLPGPL